MVPGGALRLLWLLPAAFLLAGCGSAGAGLSAVEFETGAGARPRLEVEVAARPEERAKGLSGRENLGTDRGMLFVIEERGPGFWNKDVSFPLSLAFVSACGVIVDIQDMLPFSLEIHSTGHEYRYGIEANQGWFERRGVRVGDRVRLPGSVGSSTCRSI